MTNEEKVKAYDEALKRAKEAAEKGMVSHNFVSDIFPELKESEDENIRKEIMDFVVNNTICKDGRREKYIDWLEKQGEQKEKPTKEQVWDYCNKISSEWWQITMDRWNTIADGDKNKYNQFIGFNDFSDTLMNITAGALFQLINTGKLEYEEGSLLLEKPDDTPKPLEVTNAINEKPIEEYNVPDTPIKDSEEVTSRMKYIDENLKPIAEFVIDYANWNLKKDEWNHPVATVPLFRVLDALVQKGKQYSEGCSVVDNNTEPKFKVGDWIIRNDEHTGVPVKVIEFNGYYRCELNGEVVTFTLNDVHNDFHLWTVKDAKDGNILTSIGFHNNCTFIFSGLDNWKFDEPNGDRAVATGYCCLSASANKMEFGIQGPDCIEVNTIKPATKEQRELLFAKMKEAGYEWDGKKKEPVTIGQKPYPETLDKAIELYYYSYGNGKGGFDKLSLDKFREIVRTFVDDYGKKPAWSEDDERICRCLIKDQNNELDDVRKDRYGHSEIVSDLKKIYRERIKWLKSLKEKFQ